MAAGMGSLDWPAIITTLREIDYDGALTVEFVAPVDRTPANRYPNSVETNPVDISPEEMQFIIDHGSSLLSEGFYDMLVEKCEDAVAERLSRASRRGSQRGRLPSGDAPRRARRGRAVRV